jgi:hypothetical protein
MIAPAPIPQRVALCDAVVVGKVVKFLDKTVKAARFPGDTEKADFQVAVVEVKDAVLGAKDKKEIQVGFAVPQNAPGGPVRPGRGRFGATLTLEQEVCLFLVPHDDAPFYVMHNYYDVVDKKDNADFDKDVDEAKRSAKLIADPMAGLKATQAEDRFLTAAMLIARYKTPKPSANEPKEEAIDAGESKLILQALADADWKPKNPGRFEMNPQNVFFRLGITEKDGFKQPEDFEKLPEAAKKWLKDNAEKFKLQRFVVEKKEEKKDGK